MKKLSSTLPNMLLSLTLISVVIGAILGAMNVITQKPIEEANLQARIEAIKKVVPAFDNNPIETQQSILPEGLKDSIQVFTATQGGHPVGYAIECYTDKGFSGRINLMIGFDATGKLIDFSVLQHAETPGLGAKIQEWFTSSSANPDLIRDVRNLDMTAHHPLSVVKDGGKVDAITAATISSRAFIDAVTTAYEVFLSLAPDQAGSTKADAQTGATGTDSKTGATEQQSSEDKTPNNDAPKTASQTSSSQIESSHQ